MEEEIAFVKDWNGKILVVKNKRHTYTYRLNKDNMWQSVFYHPTMKRWWPVDGPKIMINTEVTI